MKLTSQEQAGGFRPVLFLSLLICASACALLLSWFMYFLTHSGEMRLSDRERIHMLDFVRVKRNETVERKDRKPERPEMSEIPQAPPINQSSNFSGETLAVSAPDNLGLAVEIGRSGLGLGAGDGEYLPIVKVAPMYPRSALQRGLTGSCVVFYTVTTSGTVRDVQLIPGGCSDAVFEKPSLEAALRFRYKPRVIDGVPVEVQGVQNLFLYETYQSTGDNQ